MMNKSYPCRKMSAGYFILPVVVLLIVAVGIKNGNAVEKTDISGTVTYDGNPVCAMVLANGKYVFTCSGDGRFNLSDVAFDFSGQITLFAFCSGLSPYKTTLSNGATELNIALSAGSGQQPVVTIDLNQDHAGKPGWMDISGSIENEAGTPLCAMVLVNGQYVFSCNPVGQFSLTAPLDNDDAITLFAFSSGLGPFKKSFIPNESFDGRIGLLVNQTDRRDAYPDLASSPARTGFDYYIVDLRITQISGGLMFCGVADLALFDSDGQSTTVSGSAWTTNACAPGDIHDITAPMTFVAGGSVTLLFEIPEHADPATLQLTYRFGESLEDYSSPEHRRTSVGF